MQTQARNLAPHKRILLVEDDQALRVSLAQQLRSIGNFVVTEVGTAAEALAATTNKLFDVQILDVGLPDMDGCDLCRLMRRNDVKSPIIMLTGRNTDANQIMGLDAGANDYITKPFRLNLLLARLRVQLRQHEKSDDAVFMIGRYKFRPASKILLDENAGRKIRLSAKETAILKYLARSGGKVVSREELFRGVWRHKPRMTSHTLQTHIYRMRQKIEIDPSRAVLLVSEPGGYRLNQQAILGSQASHF
jgi:DNA-binding response OmpR family regulator